MEALTLTIIVVVGSIIGASIGIIFNTIVGKIADIRGYGERSIWMCQAALLLASVVAMFLYFDK